MKSIIKDKEAMTKTEPYQKYKTDSFTKKKNENQNE